MADRLGGQDKSRKVRTVDERRKAEISATFAQGGGKRTRYSFVLRRRSQPKMTPYFCNGDSFKQAGFGKIGAERTPLSHR